MKIINSLQQQATQQPNRIADQPTWNLELERQEKMWCWCWWRRRRWQQQLFLLLFSAISSVGAKFLAKNNFPFLSAFFSSVCVSSCVFFKDIFSMYDTTTTRLDVSKLSNNELTSQINEFVFIFQFLFHHFIQIQCLLGFYSLNLFQKVTPIIWKNTWTESYVIFCAKYDQQIRHSIHKWFLWKFYK